MAIRGTVESIPLSIMDFPRTILYYRKQRVGVGDIHVNTLLKLSERQRCLPTDRSRKAVEWGGYWMSDDGYGSSNITIVEELIDRGWNPGLRWLESMGEGIGACRSEKVRRFAGLQVASEIGVCFAMPPDLHIMARENKRLILYTLWESTQLPPEWAPLANLADLVVTASEFCRLILLSSGVNGPIPVIPVAIGGQYVPMQRTLGDVCKFLFVSIPYERKGLDVLVDVWKRHFADRKDAYLRIHAKKSAQRQQGAPFWVESQLSGLKNVELTTNPISDEELLELYRTHHCLVHPSRGEGFGRTPAEAIATAMPVIATGATGMTDFVNYETCFPIEVKGWRPCNHPFYTSGLWCEPDPDDLHKKMLEVMEDYPAAVRRAENGSRIVRAKFSRAVVGDAWAYLLDNAHRLTTHEEKMLFVRDFRIFMSRLQNVPLIEDRKAAEVEDFFKV